MIKNYLNVALRHLAREKANSILNIAGLTLGITGSLVLFIFLRAGSNFDNYHSNHDRIYRLVSTSKGNNGVNFSQGVPTVLPESFKNDFTEIEQVAFTSYRRSTLLGVLQPNGEFKKFVEQTGVVISQPSFFKIFDRSILLGSAESGLDDPNEAIISRKWALKYFHKEDAVGEIIKHDNTEYKITAVMEDFPTSTDLPFDLMLSYVTHKKNFDERGWNNISDSENCYFLLKENENIADVESRMPVFAQKYYGQGDSNPDEKSFFVQPLSTLHSDMRFGNYNKRMPIHLKIAFSVIAIFLMLTCCINFINLTTAAALKRTKEVGIRKVLGSTRKQLIFKLMGEVLLVTLISIVISVAVSQVLLGFVNPFMETSLTLGLSSDVVVWIFLVAVALIVVVLSGLYPSLIVSGYKPALAIKNQINNSRSSGYTIRKGLVVLQFFISQFFIISTIVITRQMDFMQEQNMGFSQEAIITVPIPIGIGAGQKIGSSTMGALKNEILRLDGVEGASLNSFPPSARGVATTQFSVPGKEDFFETQIKEVDGDYVELFKIQMLAGEPLADLDTMSGFLVNEKLVKLAGFSSNSQIIGEELNLWGKKLPVTGVVKDFNTTSLEKPIQPVVLLNNVSGFHSLSIKLRARDMQSTISNVQTRWEAAYPEYIFSYEFLDDQVRDLYKSEQKMSTLLTLFSSIAIFIGCLGLFGLVTYMANQKTKEIGVRKVLGASVESIVLLFSREFVKLILIGFAIAGPVAGFAMTKILENFAYKIELGPAIFLAGIGITFLIAFVTVGFRSIKAALVNPVESLRSE